MKKKVFVMLAIIAFIMGVFFIGSGFIKRTDVFLNDYSVSEDGTTISFDAQSASSMGYIRGFKDNGGGVKPHYLDFYSTFGGLNSSFGTASTFELEVDPDDTEIYFSRPNGGYELVLIKADNTGEWVRPNK